MLIKTALAKAILIFKDMYRGTKKINSGPEHRSSTQPLPKCNFVPLPEFIQDKNKTRKKCVTVIAKAIKLRNVCVSCL